MLVIFVLCVFLSFSNTNMYHQSTMYNIILTYNDLTKKESFEENINYFYNRTLFLLLVNKKEYKL